MGGRGVLASLLAAGLLSGCGGPSGPGAAASCVGPQVTLTPGEGTPGTPVTAAFEWLHEGCNDHSGADEETALVAVPVSFVQGGRTVPLGTVTGRGERWADALVFAVPDAALPGPAEIRLDRSAPGATPFTVLPPG
jgi:hypothetical protein